MTDDEDAAFMARHQRRHARYRDHCVFAPVPMWWPWPLERVVIDDGDPDTGLVVVRPSTSATGHDLFVRRLRSR